jgi:hypothetical protein
MVEKVPWALKEYGPPGGSADEGSDAGGGLTTGLLVAGLLVTGLLVTGLLVAAGLGGAGVVVAATAVGVGEPPAAARAAGRSWRVPMLKIATTLTTASRGSAYARQPCRPAKARQRAPAPL